MPLPERNPLRELRPTLAGIVTTGQAMPLPERRPGASIGKPRNEGESTTGEAKAEPPPAWTAIEVAAAKAECEKLTKGLAIELRYVAPIRHDQCGTPQPVEVKSLGSGHKVQLVPPALMNCRMAAMLVRWIDTSVQPQAKALIGKPIARLTNASAYVCRNRYGAKDQKLSEHAKANAIDVSAFVTTDGRTIAVTEAWGPTMAEIEAKQAAEAEMRAKAGADAAKAAATQVASTGDVLPQSAAAALAATDEVRPAAAIAPPDPKKGKRSKRSRNDAAVQPVALGDLVKGEPLIARGSEKDKKRRRGVLIARPIELQPKTPEGKFLHAIHADACRIFGTVLGPEANEAHHDHLHLDLASRRTSSFCQ
jgi:hypothetical protein